MKKVQNDMLSTKTLTTYLNTLLKITHIKDYTENGLQVEGATSINKIITAVTADLSSIEYAIEQEANCLLVHHGYFWKNEPVTITGMKKRRLSLLLQHNINLLSYHLPLDIHETYGNNVQLAKKLGFVDIHLLEENNTLCLRGELPTPMTALNLSKHIQKQLGRTPLHIEAEKEIITTVAWCTGSAQDFIDLSARYQIDAYLSGEVSERTYYSAKEQNIHYFACGHHATEIDGVYCLGQHIEEKFNIPVIFFNSHNPI